MAASFGYWCGSNMTAWRYTVTHLKLNDPTKYSRKFCDVWFSPNLFFWDSLGPPLKVKTSKITHCYEILPLSGNKNVFISGCVQNYWKGSLLELKYLKFRNLHKNNQNNLKEAPSRFPRLNIFLVVVGLPDK